MWACGSAARSTITSCASSSSGVGTVSGSGVTFSTGSGGGAHIAGTIHWNIKVSCCSDRAIKQMLSKSGPTIWVNGRVDLVCEVWAMGARACAGILGGSVVVVSGGSRVVLLVEVESVFNLIHGRHVDWLRLNEVFFWFWKVRFDSQLWFEFVWRKKSCRWGRGRIFISKLEANEFSTNHSETCFLTRQNCSKFP
jgi:hypothetical protein